MKIVYFIDNLRGDGTQRALTQLVEGLAKRGHRQAVVCLNKSYDDVLIKKLRNTSVQIRVVGKTALVSGYGLVATWLWLARERFDVVITLLFAADVIGRLLAYWSGVPRVISSLRARNVHYSQVQRWLVRSTMKAADAVVINASYTRDFAVREEGAATDRIYMIRNGVKIENYSKPTNQAALRDEMGLPKHGWLLGTVGRLTRQKGIDILLHALCLINIRDFNLLVIGMGAEETTLRALARNLGLEARVHFVGYRYDVPVLLQALDLYVHPARFEGMPNALLEAMAAARPVIATAVDGNCELIEDGAHGWLVPPEDPGALATAIERALSSPGEARRRGAAAQQRVGENFSVDAMVTAWENLLLGVRV
jgi:glycosyltransferase involved in cell wall biosynthesis